MIKYRSLRGFSLIEVMVVVVIIGMLAGVAAVAVNSRIQDGKVTKARAEIANFETALSLYSSDYGDYPTKLEDLLKRQKKSPEPYIKGGEKVLTDPWEKKYRYQIQKGIYTISSYGKDGKKGGEGYDEDIVVTNEAEK